MEIKRLILKKDKQVEPKIIMPYETFLKLRTLVLSRDIEITLLGIVEKTPKKKVYTITDFLIPPQTENSGVFTTTHDEKYPEWISKLPRETRQKMRCHLHTHPKMMVNPSGQDMKTLQDKVEDIPNYYIRVICNHNMEFRVDFFDIPKRTIFEKLEIHIFKETSFIYDLTPKGIEIYIPKAKNHKELEKDLVSKLILKIKTYDYTYKGREKFPKNQFNNSNSRSLSPIHNPEGLDVDLSEEDEEELENWYEQMRIQRGY
jgi:hypothetical protein